MDNIYVICRGDSKLQITYILCVTILLRTKDTPYFKPVYPITNQNHITANTTTAALLTGGACTAPATAKYGRNSVDSILGFFISIITRILETIVMEHIYIKNKSESSLRNHTKTLIELKLELEI